MDNVAFHALLAGVLRVALGLAVGFILYRVFRPATTAVGPMASGRRFLAWTALVAQPIQLWTPYQSLDINLFVAWLSLNIIFGLFSFLTGLVWGALRSGRSRSTPLVSSLNRIRAPEQVSVAQILDLRLAKGEISIREYEHLVSVLHGNDKNPSYPLSKPLRGERTHTKLPSPNGDQPGSPGGGPSHLKDVSPDQAPRLTVSQSTAETQKAPPPGSFSRIQWDAARGARAERDVLNPIEATSEPLILLPEDSYPENISAPVSPVGSYARIQYDAKKSKS